MNNRRREMLSEAGALLTKAAVIVESVRDDEQECFDNLPENLQESDRAQAMESAVDLLYDALEDISSASNLIEEAKYCR